MKYIFAAIFRPQENAKGFHVFFPDIEGAGTVGDDLADCLEMGSDWLCATLYDMEQAGINIPTPTNINQIEKQENDIVTLVSVDTIFYKRYYENKAIKKTLTIPQWLNIEAEKANINFSQTLQKALKEELKLA